MTHSLQPIPEIGHIRPKIVTLLTDFGLEDGYVASMKGVILSICPKVRLVDISHLIPPQDIRAGAFVLATVYRDFPQGTLHLGVVDPGVGTSRRALAIRTSRHFFVGPDNGVFSWILRREPKAQAISLENPAYWSTEVSRTFHGRDIFAPVAAHLANGVPFARLGPPCDPFTADWMQASLSAEDIRGEIIYVDRFGNAITNVTLDELSHFGPPGEYIVQSGETCITSVVATYGDDRPGTPVALIGSSGHLEIAVSQGSAARTLGLSAGNPISIKRNEISHQEALPLKRT